MSKRRYERIDALRGVSLYLMLVYHFVYDLGLFGVLSWETVFSPPLELLERYICCSFILLAGFSACLSRNNLRRGVLVLTCAAVVELISSLAGVTIRFGVLALLGSSMVLYALFGQRIQSLPRRSVLLVCGTLFCAGYWVYRHVYVGVQWLYPLGLRGYGFASADYFPLFPWFFLFLIGTVIGCAALEGPRSPWMDEKYPPWLTVPGRHTLLVYMLHQPVLYGLCRLIWGR